MDSCFLSNVSGTPPTAPATPLIGHPQPGNPGTGQLATKPGPYFYYMLVQELRNIIVEAGLTPDALDLNQVLDSLKLLFAGKAGSALQSFSAADGTSGKEVVNLSQFVTVLGAGWAYMRLPGGFLIQVGRVNLATGNGDVVTLPIPFPNALVHVVASDWGNGAYSTGWSPNGSSKSSFLGYGRVVTLTGSPYSPTALGYVAFGN